MCLFFSFFFRYDKPGNSAKERRASVPSNRKNTKNLSSSESMSSIDSVISEKEISCTSRRRRRRSSFFRLPFRIWEESEFEKDNESDDSKTLVQVNATLESNCNKSLIENSCSIMQPMSLGSFPKPTPGQSIMSFLTSGAFSQMTTELDRENAHFNISEAIIAAFEQVEYVYSFFIIFFCDCFKNMKKKCFSVFCINFRIVISRIFYFSREIILFNLSVIN